MYINTNGFSLYIHTDQATSVIHIVHPQSSYKRKTCKMASYLLYLTHIRQKNVQRNSRHSVALYRPTPTWSIKRNQLLVRNVVKN